MKKLFVLAVFLCSFTMLNTLKAEWVQLSKSSKSNTKPVVQVLSHSAKSTVVRIDISGFEVKEKIIDGKLNHSIDLLSDVFTTKVGHPELPYLSEILAIPNKSGVSVDIVGTGDMYTFQGYEIQPARESWYEGEAETLFEKDQLVYGANQIFPNVQAEIGEPSIFRDLRIARLAIYPIRYLPSKKELQVLSSVTVRVNYTNAKTSNVKNSPKRKIAPSFGQIYRSSILNYEQVLKSEYDNKENGHDVMLCIMPDEFVNSFKPYAEWKRQSGIDVHVTKFSDIGANASNPTTIKDHVSDAYYNWDNPPTYVLIVGDDGVFPKKIVNYDYSFPNEDYFVEIEGDDFFPEMMIGRFSNQTDYRLQVMVSKFKNYEKEPYVEETDWYKNGICCSNNAYESQVETKRFTARVMREDGGFRVDTLMSDGYSGNCSMDLNDVLDAIIEGRSYLNYRGEGWNNGWWASCYPFETSDVSGMNNGKKLTFVTSIGCGVSMFDASGGNSFGEQWVKQGTISEPRGGAAFVGPTSNTHTTYNNRIDKGIYVGMFREGMDTPGQALLRGKLYMYNVFGNDPWVEYHYRVFCVLGDPSIHIWKEVPLEVEVTHAPTVPLGYSQQEFIVKEAASGNNIANAQVTITGNEIFYTGYTDENGALQLDFTIADIETLKVTVRGGNVIPYQGEILVLQEDEYIAIENEPTITDIDGNTDGLINPNENCNFSFSIKNWGTQTANNVQATLSITNSEYIDVVTTGAISYGNVAPNTIASANPFQFFVQSDCPVGEQINFDIHITSTNFTWDYSFTAEVDGCELRFKDAIVEDTSSALANYRMDPGETVDLYISTINIGKDKAVNVKGTLRSTDPYIIIEDSIGIYGDIDVGVVLANLNDKFVVTVDSDCPTDYLANYTLVFETNGGNYNYITTRNFTIPVAKPAESDFTGPDDYGYYAYSSNDDIFDQAPDYDWFEVSTSGTQLNVPVGYSNYTETVDLPFTFKYYGIDYDQIRISTDGWIAFGNGSQTNEINSSLPSNDNVNNMVAAFWDDLYDSWEENGHIYYHHNVLTSRFIIEWHNVSHNNTATVMPEVFQIVLLDPSTSSTPTDDGEIILYYKDLSHTTSNTVGIENSTQDIGLQYVYNNTYDPTANQLVSPLAIKFTTEEPTIPLPNKIVDANKGNNTQLHQNHPNPFKYFTQIQFSLSKSSQITVEIYNVSGELVNKLQLGKKSSGNHTIIWDGTGSNGQKLNPGIYIYKLRTEDFVATKKLLLLK